LVKEPSGEFPHILNQKPHIFLIMIDAARYNLIDKIIEGEELTPNINRFAKRSVVFSNFYAPAPYTLASVVSMLSGLYPETHSARYRDSQMPEGIKTLPQYLSSKGYFSAAFVGNLVLFNHNLIKDFDTRMNVRGDKFRLNSYNDIMKINQYLMEADFKIPQFHYYHLLPPHEPYHPPAPFDQKFIKINYIRNHNRFRKKMKEINKFRYEDTSFRDVLYKCYLNNVHYADYMVGEILKRLKEKKIFRQSLIILTSDHGEAFGEHGLYGHNSSHFNEMIKIPFMLKMPDQENRRVVKGVYGLIDILLAMFDWLGIKENNSLQGKSFVPALSSHSLEPSNRFLYSRAVSNEYHFALIGQQWKLIFNRGQSLLFDLNNDPQETSSLSDDFPFQVGFLKQKAFSQFYKNLDLRKKLKIKPKKIKDMEKYRQELKTLGYL